MFGSVKYLFNNLFFNHCGQHSISVSISMFPFLSPKPSSFSLKTGKNIKYRKILKAMSAIEIDKSTYNGFLVALTYSLLYMS